MSSIKEEGVVIDTNGESAIVRIDKAGACAHCKVGCMEQGGSMVTEAENSAGAGIGDTVLLKFDSKMALIASLVVFGLPLLSLLLGIIITETIANQLGYNSHRQLLNIGGGAILFFLSFILVKAYDRRIKENGSHNVVVADILKESHIVGNVSDV